MPSKAHCQAALLFLACVLLAAAVLAFSGCGRWQAMDAAFWGTPPQNYTVTMPDGTTKVLTTDPGRPGIIDAVAGLLATFGFGGTALWLRSVRNTGNGKIAALEARLSALENPSVLKLIQTGPTNN